MCFIDRILAKQKQKLCHKIVEPTILASLYTSLARSLKSASQPCEELNPPLRNPFKEPVSKQILLKLPES